MKKKKLKNNIIQTLNKNVKYFGIFLEGETRILRYAIVLQKDELFKLDFSKTHGILTFHTIETEFKRDPKFPSE